MSLINQMLKDLEQRRSPEGSAEQQGLLHDVQVLPELEATVWLRTVTLGGLLLVLIGGFGWWGYRTLQRPAPLPQATEAAVKGVPLVAPPVSEGVTPAEPTPLVVAVQQQVEEPKAATAMEQPPPPAPRLDHGQVKPKPKGVSSAAASKAQPVAVPPPLALTKVPRPLSPGEQAEAAFQRAQAAQREGQALPMETELRLTLQLDPSHLPAREALAVLLYRSGRLAEATQVLQGGINEESAPVVLRKVLARVLVDQGQPEAAALTLLQGGAPPVSQDPEFHQLLAAIYQQTGQFGAAAQTYRQLLMVQRQAGVWWLGLGLALESDGLPVAAQQAYRKALDDRTLQAGLGDFVRNRLAALVVGGGN